MGTYQFVKTSRLYVTPDFTPHMARFGRSFLWHGLWPLWQRDFHRRRCGGSYGWLKYVIESWDKQRFRNIQSQLSSFIYYSTIRLLALHVFHFHSCLLLVCSQQTSCLFFPTLACWALLPYLFAGSQSVVGWTIPPSLWWFSSLAILWPLSEGSLKSNCLSSISY